MPAKGRGRSRGRKSTQTKKANLMGKKSKLSTSVSSDDEQDEEMLAEDEDQATIQFEDSSSQETASINIEEDISKLEAPTFTTIDRGPPEPLHNNAKLRWDYKVNLIGEKVVNPLLHCCEKCSLPILVYGRMIPCKHVFCLDCGKAAEKSCPRCHDKVTRVEQSTLGTVFMCMYGGSRHAHNGCRRTYLSQRDLQAHVNHRHLRPAAAAAEGSSHRSKSSPKFDSANIVSSKSPGSMPPSSRDPRCHTVQTSSSSLRTTTTTATAVHQTSNQTYSTPIPVMSTRTNLITVPIQDSSVQPVAVPAAEYSAYTSAPVSTLPQTTSAIAHPTTYQIQVSNPYVRPPPAHPVVPISYPTLQPATYATPISSSQVLSFSQPPLAHPTHLPPPPLHTPAVAMPQLYSTPPPAGPRQAVSIAPGSRPRQPYQVTSQYEDVRVRSPPYQWQGSGPPPRGVPPPTRPPSYRPRYYQ